MVVIDGVALVALVIDLEGIVFSLPNMSRTFIHL